MKKKILFIAILLFLSLIFKTNVYAFDSSNYRGRVLQDVYEIVEMHPDGEMVTVVAYNSYAVAHEDMVARERADLVIMTTVNGETAIVDANNALLDLTVNPQALTYYYTNEELTGASYTYMDNGTLYGGVDGAHLGSHYSNAYGTWTAKVQIGGVTGWIPKSTYEIVPITWVKSASNYTVTTTDIRHNYVAKVQNTYSGSSGRTIGPKPDMLAVGNYYSYDGHYFYTNLETLIVDVRNGSHENAVNKDEPYYNYYMYLSNHTKTSYSSSNIDEYIRNNLGYKEDAYGVIANEGTSRLYGSGIFFYYAQEKFGVNAVLSLGLSRNETGNGRSYLAVNKNNGFGLNAVDSDPINGASWYPTFASSILGYASKWITYGYAHPRDWRYFGPQFGDKGSGMNVKYASDTFWSEKMASNYYSFDKAFGLQDYNYYQLGIVTGPTKAYISPSTSARVIYTYPEREDALVIVDEVKVGNETWYKVMSDINLDANGYEVTSGYYNWNSYVYVPASSVQKINQGKNGNMNPNDVFEYEDAHYEYNVFVENMEHKPKTAITTKQATYYYDSTLSSSIGKSVQKDRYVMVHAGAYIGNTPVAYLITSDYWHDQKHWVSADSIKFVTMTYGVVNVSVEGNQYTWVNYNTEDAKYSLISGLYTYTAVPIIEEINVNGTLWYKVPVNLTGNNNIYGYTLASAPGVTITKYTYSTGNNPPVISAKDQTIVEGSSFEPKKNVTASDAEDGDLTSQIEIIENTVNTTTPGKYKVTYRVKDSTNQTTELTVNITVAENNAPVIQASNQTIYVGESFNPKQNVTASDAEDGDLTNNVVVKTNTVDPSKVGTYKVVYEVVDSLNKKTTKEIQVIVKEKVVINPEDTTLEELMEGATDGEYSLNSLSWDKDNKVFTISGYCIIQNRNNSDAKEYSLVFVNKETKETIQTSIGSWKDNTPYNLGTRNGYSYTNSWFKGTIDFTNIKNGDYDIYVVASDQGVYTVQLVDNFFNEIIDRRGEDSHHGYSFKVLDRLRTQQIELSVRDHLITTSEAPTYRNMVNEIEKVKFQNNKLYVQGFSYNFNGIYDKQSAVTRNMIVENQTTYQQTTISLGSIKGPYTLSTKDKKDKTYAWFEKEIDLSSLEKGTYTVLIHTKTANAEDYGELSDMFGEVNETMTINNKTYIVTYNQNRSNRIEIVVE